MSLTLIPPVELNNYWPVMREAIQGIIDDINKDIKQEFWIPEDVFASIKAGESVLFWHEDGFVVMQRRVDRYSGYQKAYVWLAHSFEPSKNLMEETSPDINAIAKEWGCQFVEFSTIRRGFAKVAIKMGYSHGPSTYVMRI